MGLRCAVAQLSFPSPFISMAQASVFNPSGRLPTFLPLVIRAGAASGNLLCVLREARAEIKRTGPFGKPRP